MNPHKSGKGVARQESPELANIGFHLGLSETTSNADGTVTIKCTGRINDGIGGFDRPIAFYTTPAHNGDSSPVSYERKGRHFLESFQQVGDYSVNTRAIEKFCFTIANERYQALAAFLPLEDIRGNFVPVN